MNASSRHQPTDWTLQSLLIGYADVASEDNVAIGGMAADSRRVVSGDLFFAIAGGGRHGLEFATQAQANGAVAVAYESETADQLPDLDIPMVPVEQLTARLGLIADRFCFEPSEHLAMVGVTGTNGKTSVSHFIADALAHLRMPCGVIGTLGYGFPGKLEETGYTTPDAVTLQLGLKSLKHQGAAAVAMEVSSHALSQHRVSGVHFDVAVFTNLSRDHLDYHGDMVSYAQAKHLLLTMPGLRHAVINGDDATGREWLTSLPSGVNVIAFTASDSSMPVPALRGSNVCVDAHGLSLDLHWQGETARVDTRLIGHFNVENLLATAGALLALGYPFNVVVKALPKIRPVPGRMEQVASESKPLVIVDYAHTPDALEKALRAAREHCQGSLLCVFGCGGDRDTGKRPLMATVAEQNADEVFVTDDNPRTESPKHIVNDILAGFVAPASVRVIHDRAEAIRFALEEATDTDVVLVAGKGHEQYQLIGEQEIPFSDQQVVAEWQRGGQ